MKTLLLTLLSLFATAAHMSATDVVASEGAWCWFADPRALHYRNEAGTIDASYVGYIDVHGNIMATQYDYLTMQKSDVLIRSAFQPDDHDNPTFLVLPDERIFIIYSRHTDEACFYYRISTRPGDITSLGAEHRLATKNNTTYPSPFILSDDPTHIYLCWRGIGWHPTIAKLTMPDANDEVQFAYGPYQMVQSTGARPYAKYYSNGKDKLYFTYTTGHPDNEYPDWLYFNVVNINGSDGPQLEDIDGRKLKTISTGTFAVNKTDSYKSNYPKTVVDATADRRDWVWQLTCDEAKRPVIAMVKITNDKNTHDYYYARWNGTTWQKTFLANGGGRFHTSNTEYCYSGGMAIDPDDHRSVYLSCPTNGAYEIWHYTMTDDGKVAAKEQVTDYGRPNDAAAMTGGNVRPFILPGSTGKPMRLMWMNGYYQYWIVKQGYPLGYPTAIHTEGQWNEAPTTPTAPLWTATDTERSFVLPQQFTIMMNVALNGLTPNVTLVDAPSFSYNIDKYACVRVGTNTYTSANKYCTSDDFATRSTGTSSDWWDTPIASSWVTLTFDGTTLTAYRDNLIDQRLTLDVSTDAQALTNIPQFEGRLNSARVWDKAMTPAEVQQHIRQYAIEQIATLLPSSTCTDLVLPANAGTQSIAWSSSHPDIIAPDGTFAYPATDTRVTLTATIAGETHDYTITAQAFQSLQQNTLLDITHFGNSPAVTLMGNAKVTDGALDLTANTATGFSANGYALLPDTILDGLRSYTIVTEVTPKTLDHAPRIYDLGAGSGNSLFCRANTLVAGIKYAGGTTTFTSASTQLTTAERHKVAVTFDARTHLTRIYLDGQLVASGTENLNEPYMIAQSATCNRCYLGRTQWWDSSVAADNADFCGTIHRFAMFNTALTEAQVLTLQGYKVQDETLNVDCTDRLTNADFEASYTIKSGSGVDADRAIYAPQGWQVELSNINRYDMSIVSDKCLYANLFATIPLTQGGGSQAYLVRQKYGNSVITLSQVADALPAAVYELRADLWQSGLGGNISLWAKPGSRQQQSATAPGNATAWQQAAVRFVCDGTEAVTIGISATHNSDGSEKLLGADNLRLLDVTANATAQELATLAQLTEAVPVTAPAHITTPRNAYDLQGRPLAHPARGISISDGRKLLVQ